MRNLFSAGLVVVLFSARLLAQSSNAVVGGTVSDPTGALIPGVSVKANNTQTGVVSTTITNESGIYQFPPLQPGTYKVSAELPGFQTHVYNDTQLGISQQVRLKQVTEKGLELF